MTHRLDIVAVGIEYEGTIVVRVVMRPQAWRAIVLATGGNGGVVEGVDRSRFSAANAICWW